MPFNPPANYASKGNTGYEATFSFGTLASPDSYNALLEVKSIKNNGVSIPEVPLTHLQSPAATEESAPGLIKPGTLELTGNFIGDSTQLSFLQLAAAQETFTWKLTGSVQQGAKTYTATGLGWVTKYDNGPWENNKAVEYAVSIQITGPITESVA